MLNSWSLVRFYQGVLPRSMARFWWRVLYVRWLTLGARGFLHDGSLRWSNFRLEWLAYPVCHYPRIWLTLPTQNAACRGISDLHDTSLRPSLSLSGFECPSVPRPLGRIRTTSTSVPGLPMESLRPCSRGLRLPPCLGCGCAWTGSGLAGSCLHGRVQAVSRWSDGPL